MRGPDRLVVGAEGFADLLEAGVALTGLLPRARALAAELLSAAGPGLSRETGFELRPLQVLRLGGPVVIGELEIGLGFTERSDDLLRLVTRTRPNGVEAVLGNPLRTTAEPEAGGCLRRLVPALKVAPQGGRVGPFLALGLALFSDLVVALAVDEFAAL